MISFLFKYKINNIQNNKIICFLKGNYLSDFSFISSANITLQSDIVYENSNPEQCSLLCVTSDAFSCKSFDFCPESKTCLLNSALAKKLAFNAADAKRDICNNFKSKARSFYNYNFGSL